MEEKKAEAPDTVEGLCTFGQVQKHYENIQKGARALGEAILSGAQNRRLLSVVVLSTDILSVLQRNCVLAPHMHLVGHGGQRIVYALPKDLPGAHRFVDEFCSVIGCVEIIGPVCPSAGDHGPMKLRKAGRGEHAGKEFWGCDHYPECRRLYNINSTEFMSFNRFLEITSDSDNQEEYCAAMKQDETAPPSFPKRKFTPNETGRAYKQRTDQVPVPAQGTSTGRMDSNGHIYPGPPPEGKYKHLQVSGDRQIFIKQDAADEVYQALGIAADIIPVTPKEKWDRAKADDNTPRHTPKEATLIQELEQASNHINRLSDETKRLKKLLKQVGVEDITAEEATQNKREEDDKKYWDNELIQRADRTFRFLAGLNLQDHSLATQREQRDVLSSLGDVLRLRNPKLGGVDR